MNITKRHAGLPASISRRSVAIWLVLAAGPLAGCVSSMPEAQPPKEPPQGALNTGTYPNLNIPPQTAAAAISEDDKERINSRIGAAQGRQAAVGRGAGTRGDPEVLKRLAEHHGEDTLNAIAGR